jgi:threonine dehydrogenase-like Zn-dependent dehydrogenase
LRAALEVVQTASVDLASLHTHAWPLAEAAEAFRMAEERPTGFVKGVLCP